MTRIARLPRVTAGLALALLVSVGCKNNPSKLDKLMADTDLNKGRKVTTVDTSKPGDPAAPAKDIDSKDILGRSETSASVQVKHVLLAWKDLAGTYGGRMDPRAEKRTNDEAAALAQEIAGKLKANPDSVDALVKEHSEDPGSQSGDPYEVKADTQFVPEFKQLALRLMLNEVGIVKTQFGYHVMIRVPPPKPDPLESTDIMTRTDVSTTTVQVQHVLIGWKGAPGARTATRSKEEADKIAQDILAKVRGGADMVKLMKEHSEDPGSKDSGMAYDVAPDSAMVEPFKNLSLRLKMGEAGLVKSPFGWHVIKRVPPPPPDSLESADILKREPVAQKTKVKHILLGWTEVHGQDERGTKRDRATLEKLVKDTMGKLKNGAKIEPLMAELSEDPGSAKTGEGYDVTPDSNFVEPFKQLALRLKVGEVGAVKTQFGIHIMQRVDGQPEPIDPKKPGATKPGATTPPTPKPATPAAAPAEKPAAPAEKPATPSPAPTTP